MDDVMALMSHSAAALNVQVAATALSKPIAG